jgi:hypothetical protein
LKDIHQPNVRTEDCTNGVQLRSTFELSLVFISALRELQLLVPEVPGHKFRREKHAVSSSCPSNGYVEDNSYGLPGLRCFFLLFVARAALKTFFWREHAQKDARALLGQLRMPT